MLNKNLYDKVYSISEVIDQYDLVLMDIWGTIISEGSSQKMVPINDNIPKLINQHFLSNKITFVSNAPILNDQISKTLNSIGIKVRDLNVVTSGSMTKFAIENLKIAKGFSQEQKVKVYHLGYDSHKSLWQNSNVEETNEISTADLLLIATHSFDKSSTEHDDLLRKSADNNITAICANPDQIFVNHNMANPQVVYLAGFFARKYENYGGKVIYTGKPGIEIFQHAMNISQRKECNKVIVIGDSLDTDILGANNLEIDSGLTINTGNCKFEISKFHGDSNLDKARRMLENSSIKPTFLVEW